MASKKCLNCEFFKRCLREDFEADDILADYSVERNINSELLNTECLRLKDIQPDKSVAGPQASHHHYFFIFAM